MKWNKAEGDKCISLLKKGYSYKEISEVIERTESSIRNFLSNKGENKTKYKKPISTKCLNCELIFESKKYENRKFCSHKCSATFNNKTRKITKKCIICYNKLPYKSKFFCSKECEFLNKKNIKYKKIEEGNSNFSERVVKKYLIEKHGEKCMCCGWCKIHPITGKVPIQIEHIDGNSTNNNLDNLKLLCPNCHSLTPTFGALNKGNGRKNRKR